MSNLIFKSLWSNNITQVDLTDPITGGVSGTANVPNKELAGCSLYLKNNIDDFTKTLKYKNDELLVLRKNINTSIANLNINISNQSLRIDENTENNINAKFRILTNSANSNLNMSIALENTYRPNVNSYNIIIGLNKGFLPISKDDITLRLESFKIKSGVILYNPFNYTTSSAYVNENIIKPGSIDSQYLSDNITIKNSNIWNIKSGSTLKSKPKSGVSDLSVDSNGYATLSNNIIWSGNWTATNSTIINKAINLGINSPGWTTYFFIERSSPGEWTRMYYTKPSQFSKTLPRALIYGNGSLLYYLHSAQTKWVSDNTRFIKSLLYEMRVSVKVASTIKQSQFMWNDTNHNRMSLWINGAQQTPNIVGTNITWNLPAGENVLIQIVHTGREWDKREWFPTSIHLSGDFIDNDNIKFIS